VCWVCTDVAEELDPHAAFSSTLIMQGAGSSEIFVHTYETIWHHIPEQGHLHDHKCDCRLD